MNLPKLSSGLFARLQIINDFFQQSKVLFVHSNISHRGSTMINIDWFSISEVIPLLEVVMPLTPGPVSELKRLGDSLF